MTWACVKGWSSQLGHKCLLRGRHSSEDVGDKEIATWLTGGKSATGRENGKYESAGMFQGRRTASMADIE